MCIEIHVLHNFACTTHIHVSQNLNFFCFSFSDYPFRIFPCPSPFLFSLQFYFSYLLSCIYFLAAVKSLVLVMDRAQKWDLDQHYDRYSGPFYHHFSPKRMGFFLIC